MTGVHQESTKKSAGLIRIPVDKSCRSSPVGLLSFWDSQIFLDSAGVLKKEWHFRGSNPRAQALIQSDLSMASASCDLVDMFSFFSHLNTSHFNHHHQTKNANNDEDHKDQDEWHTPRMDEDPTWSRIAQTGCWGWGQWWVGDNKDGNNEDGTTTKMATRMEDWGNNGDRDDKDGGNNEDGDHKEDGVYDKNVHDAGRDNKDRDHNGDQCGWRERDGPRWDHDEGGDNKDTQDRYHDEDGMPRMRMGQWPWQMGPWGWGHWGWRMMTTRRPTMGATMGQQRRGPQPWQQGQWGWDTDNGDHNRTTLRMMTTETTTMGGTMMGTGWLAYG
jgi:hypothetical protein